MKSRSNSRGSILEDFLMSQAVGNRNTAPSLNLSLTAVLGNTDYDKTIGTSQSSSIVQGFHRIHESTCQYICYIKLIKALCVNLVWLFMYYDLVKQFQLFINYKVFSIIYYECLSDYHIETCIKLKIILALYRKKPLHF